MMVHANNEAALALLAGRYGNDVEIWIVDSACDVSTRPTPSGAVPSTSLGDCERAPHITDAGGLSHATTETRVEHGAVITTAGGALDVDLRCVITPGIPHKLWSVDQGERAGVYFTSGPRAHLKFPNGDEVRCIRVGSAYAFVVHRRQDEHKPTTLAAVVSTSQQSEPTTAPEQTPRETSTPGHVTEHTPAVNDATHAGPAPAPTPQPKRALTTASAIGLIITLAIAGAGPGPAALSALASRSGLPLTPPTSAKLMRGFTFDARRAHLTFAHAADARVDDVLEQLALPPVERGHDEAHLCCTLGRLRFAPTYATSRNAEAQRSPGTVVEIDLQGPFFPPTIGGARYGVDFAFRDPPALYTALVASKSDAAAEVAPFAAHARAIGFQIQVGRTDMGGELVGREFAEACGRVGIAAEYVVPERKLGTGEVSHLRIADVARANNVLVNGVLGPRFWGYAYLHAVTQINATGGHKGAFGAAVDVSALAPYGSLVAARVAKHAKMEQRAEMFVYLGPATAAGPGACSIVPVPTPGNTQNDLRLVRTSASVVFIAAPGERVPSATIAGALSDAATEHSSESSRVPPIVAAAAPPPPPISSAPGQKENSTSGLAAERSSQIPPIVAAAAPPPPRPAPPLVAAAAQSPSQLVVVADAPDPPLNVTPRIAAAFRVANDPTFSATVAAARSIATRALAAVSLEHDEHLPHGHDDGPPFVEPPPVNDAPKTIPAALYGPDADAWYNGIDAEWNAIVKYGAVDIIPRSSAEDDARIYGIVMGFKKKKDGRFKVRSNLDGSTIAASDLAACSPAEQEGTLVTSTTPHYASPAADVTCVFVFFALAATFEHETICGDAQNAYLQADELPKEMRVLARPPPGFDVYLRRKYDGAPPFRAYDVFFQIIRPLYGHPVAGRWWNETFLTFIVGELGFEVSDFHPSFLFRREIDAPPTLLLTIVDDTPIAGAPHHVADVRARISARFVFTWQDPVTDVVGIDVTHTARGIALSQTRAMNGLLSRLGYADVAAVPDAPLPTRWSPDPDKDDGAVPGGAPPRVLEPRAVLGALRYLTACYPQLAFPVHSLLTAVPIWAPKHARALVSCLRYAAGCRDQCVFYSSSYAGRIEITAYADETLGSELAIGARGLALSRSGGVILLNGAKVDDFSRRQTSTQISTPQTCIVAAALIVQRVIILRRLIVQATNRPLPPTVVHIDNRTAIKTIRKRLLGQSARHLRLALNILISALDSKEVAYRWVDSQSNVADMYTAAEDSARLRRNLDVILGEA
jgi:hypothetical protein